MDAHINTSVNWSACADVRVGTCRWPVGGAAVVSITNYRPQRSWGKVIFSEACVNNSVHGGERAWLHRGGGMHGFIWGACVVLFGGHAWFYLGGVRGFIWGGMHGFIWGGMRGFIRGHAWFYWGVCMVFSVFSDTMRYGQWAGGTHPTGMHSCLLINFIILRKIWSDFHKIVHGRSRWAGLVQGSDLALMLKTSLVSQDSIPQQKILQFAKCFGKAKWDWVKHTRQLLRSNKNKIGSYFTAAEPNILTLVHLPMMSEFFYWTSWFSHNLPELTSYTMGKYQYLFKITNLIFIQLC